jgi:glutathione S-transferase
VVPAMVLEDGTTIGEVPAIMRYFDEAFPDTPMLGTTPKDKGLVVMWERFAELEGFAAVMEGVRNRAEGSVSARASRYTFVLRGKVWASPGLQDADRREGPGEDVQSAVIGGNMLVAV